MNVEYRCPTCGARGFFKPGGTKIHCPRHPDTLFEQVEEAKGPDFLNIGLDGKTESQDKILPGNVRQAPEPGEQPIPANAELILMRNLYQQLTDEVPDGRWSAETIKSLIAERMGGTKDAVEPEEPTTPGEEVESIPEPAPGDEDEDDGSEVNPGASDEDVILASTS